MRDLQSVNENMNGMIVSCQFWLPKGCLWSTLRPALLQPTFDIPRREQHRTLAKWILWPADVESWILSPPTVEASDF